MAVIHAVGDKTNKVKYTPMGAKKCDVPTVISEQHEAIAIGERQLHERDTIDKEWTAALRRERHALKERIRSIEARNTRGALQVDVEEQQKLEQRTDAENADLSEAEKLLFGDTDDVSVLDVLNAAKSIEKYQPLADARAFNNEIEAQHRIAAQKEKDLETHKRVLTAAEESLKQVQLMTTTLSMSVCLATDSFFL